MSRISEAFARGKAMISFLPVGDPSLARTREYMTELDRAGADIIGLVLPSFRCGTDPGDNEADAGSSTKMEDVFEICASFRARRKTPLAFMTCQDPIRCYGEEKFFHACRRSGIDGILIPDVSGEQEERLRILARQNEVSWIPMLPAGVGEDIHGTTAKADGFIYLTSAGNDQGGMRKENTELTAVVREIRLITDTPAVVGFGIHTTDQATLAARCSDGIVVGSIFANLIARYGSHAAPHIYTYARMMKEAVRAAER